MPDPVETRLERLGFKPKATPKSKKKTHVLEEPPSLKGASKSSKRSSKKGGSA